MKPAAALLLLLSLAYVARRPLFRLYLWLRDAVTDAPLSDGEAWVYRRIEE